MKEKYIPSQEEINKAESMMTDEQREISENRIKEVDRETGTSLDSNSPTLQSNQYSEDKALEEAAKISWRAKKRKNRRVEIEGEEAGEPTKDDYQKSEESIALEVALEDERRKKWVEKLKTTIEAIAKHHPILGQLKDVVEDMPQYDKKDTSIGRIRISTDFKDGCLTISLTEMRSTYSSTTYDFTFHPDGKVEQEIFRNGLFESSGSSISPNVDFWRVRNIVSALAKSSEEKLTGDKEHDLKVIKSLRPNYTNFELSNIHWAANAFGSDFIDWIKKSAKDEESGERLVASLPRAIQEAGSNHETVENIQKYLKDSIVVDLGAGSRDFKWAASWAGAKEYVAIDLPQDQGMDNSNYGKEVEITPNPGIEEEFKQAGIDFKLTKEKIIYMDILEALYTRIPDDSSCIVMFGVDETGNFRDKYIELVNGLIAKKVKIGGIVINRGSQFRPANESNFQRIQTDNDTIWLKVK